MGTEHIDYDLIVVGTGASGMTAAIVAHSKGMRVLLVEKANHVGGTTAYSGGACWVPGSDQQRSQGVEDGAELALKYLDNTVSNQSDRDARITYLQRAPEAFREIERISHLKFYARLYTPDYYSEREGAQSNGRVLLPENFDGTLLGERFLDIRPPLPELSLFGTSMIDGTDLNHLLNAGSSPRSAYHTVKLVLRDLKDRLLNRRFKRGLRLTGGNAMVAGLYKTILDNDIPVLLETQLVGLVRDSERVIGIKVQTKGGGHRDLHSAQGVVLATGGFPWSELLRDNHISNVAFGNSATSPDSTGDGISVALENGAKFDERHTNGAFFTPISIARRSDGSIARFPHLMADRSKPGLIAVNAEGKRFCNESENYHAFVQAMIGDSNSAPLLPTHLICDHRFVTRFVFGMAIPLASARRRHIRSGYLIRASTIEELAHKIGVDPKSLGYTIDAYNDDARGGFDSHFGKGSSRYNRHLGDPHQQPNPCLAPIDKGPYYAIRVHAGDIGTIHGLMADSHSRVLDHTGKPIPGLYACGNDRGSIMGGDYPAGGITLGPALTFAYLAALHAAEGYDSLTEIDTQSSGAKHHVVG